MNVSSAINISTQFFMKATYAGKATSGVGQPVSGANRLAEGETTSIEILYSTRTEMTLQAKEIVESPNVTSVVKGLESQKSENAFLDGFWGVEQTAKRIAGFVLNYAGNDEEKLRIGRDSILKGFKEAEEIWNGNLPDISYKTINRAVSLLDDKIHSLNQSVISVAV